MSKLSLFQRMNGPLLFFGPAQATVIYERGKESQTYYHYKKISSSQPLAVGIFG